MARKFISTNPYDYDSDIDYYDALVLARTREEDEEDDEEIRDEICEEVMADRMADGYFNDHLDRQFAASGGR